MLQYYTVLYYNTRVWPVSLLQGVVTLICTVLTAKTWSRKFDRTGNQPMTVDYTHILSFDPIYRRKQLHPFLSIWGQDAWS